MTPGRAREFVTDVRGRLGGVMRALSVPRPDWSEAERLSGECVTLCARLEGLCRMERRKSERKTGERP